MDAKKYWRLVLVMCLPVAVWLLPAGGAVCEDFERCEIEVKLEDSAWNGIAEGGETNSNHQVTLGENDFVVIVLATDDNAAETALAERSQ